GGRGGVGCADVGTGEERGDARGRMRLDAGAQRLHGTRLELVEELMMPDDREYEAPRVGQLLGIRVQDRVELRQILEGEREERGSSPQEGEGAGDVAVSQEFGDGAVEQGRSI